VPCATLAIVGIRSVLQDEELHATRVAEARGSLAADVSRSLVEQLQGIVTAEVAAPSAATEPVESATAFVGRLTTRGLEVQRRSAHGGDAHDSMLIDRLTRDATTLARVRGAFGEPRILSYDDGRWLLAMRYVDGGDPRLVAVRVRDLVGAAGVALGDSLRVAAGTPAHSIALSGGIDGLSLVWINEPAARPIVTGPRVSMIASLALAVIVGLIGTFLLVRDVRRETQLARTQQQFVASVSHELKTPLTSIRMFADTLRDGRLPAASREEYLATIVGQTERLTRLVDNVLDFAQVEQGTRAFRFTEGDLLPVVQRAVATLRYLLEQEGFAISIRADAPLPRARFDADALERVVLNLLSNAMKYSAEKREIEIEIWLDGGEMVLSVRDHGIGIPAAERQRVFERFYRAAQVPAEVAGTGLGLTLVQHTAAAHGGRVTVESTPGEGSVFSVCLPLAST
jgi:signal transduction histidine kinase